MFNMGQADKVVLYCTMGKSKLWFVLLLYEEHVFYNWHFHTQKSTSVYRADCTCDATEAVERPMFLYQP